MKKPAEDAASTGRFYCLSFEREKGSETGITKGRSITRTCTANSAGFADPDPDTVQRHATSRTFALGNWWEVTSEYP
jgi:hypothetical protein